MYLENLAPVTDRSLFVGFVILGGAILLPDITGPKHSGSVKSFLGGEALWQCCNPFMTTVTVLALVTVHSKRGCV